MKRLLTALAAGASALTWAAYFKDITDAKRRIETGNVLDGIEFGESGEGPPVLVIHGAGGGFDQGLALGRGFLGNGYRIIAPSRFGYLGTPLPANASAEAQADAHARLLDALQINSVQAIGVSASASSAVHFCLRHPERCTALVLVVPMAYVPDRAPVRELPPFFAAALNVMAESDFLFWMSTKVAHAKLVQTLLGTPIEVYRNATRAERHAVDFMMRSVLPISRRAAGIRNESAVASALTRPALEEIAVPTLIISAEDCLYGTYANSVYTAGQIPHAKLVTFETGGHLLVGHEAEVRSQLRSVLTQPTTDQHRAEVRAASR